MTTTPHAAASGQFLVDGDIAVHRLGFGAIRLTGKGIWGDSAKPDSVRATLRQLPEFDVNLVDAADSCGTKVSENLIREVRTRTRTCWWPPREA